MFSYIKEVKTTKRLKLKQLRIGLDLNQTKMAVRCKIDRNTYSLIELGKREGSADFWFNLKKEFNLSPEQVWAMQYEGKE